MNKTESIRAKCPFYRDVDQSKKTIICSEEMAPYSQIRIVFARADERREWSDDYCDGFMFQNCPFYMAIESEIPDE